MVTYLRRNHLALLALFIALGGTSYAAAALPRNSVGPKQLRPNAVRSPDVRNGTLRREDFRPGTLLRGAKGDTGPRGATGTVDTSNFFTKAQTDARYPRLATASAALVLKQVVSDHSTDDELVAKAGPAEFRRDTSSEVSFRVVNPGASDVNINCHGVTIGGAPTAKRATIDPGADALVLAGGDAVQGFTCQLLYTGAALNQTQVTLQNRQASSLWVGTLISTDDQ